MQKNLSPVPDSARPFAHNVPGCQIEHFKQSVVRREDALSLYDLPELAAIACDHIGCVADFAHFGLFKGYVWNRIAVKDRLLLGILFLSYVNSANGNLPAIEKTSSHKQEYRKNTIGKG